ncbi:hypothetical protein KBH77_02710 [Patescibacteria group bacterium]|nr:hypothetical protein [Patescibacteria group bacterium]HQA87778.1 hypothetical protein [Candidatus Dojkabacteria bacterium]
MLDIIQNSNVWFTLGFLYLGIFFYLIGLARHQNNIISGIGILIVVSGFIFGVLKISLGASIIILIFAYVTRTIIPGYLGYLYWKLRYKPKFLTNLRFQFLVSDQDERPQTTPTFMNAVIDLAVKNGLGEKFILQRYVEEVFESESKYVVEEVLGNYNIFSYYVNLREKYKKETAINIMRKELGIIPLNRIEQELKMDEFQQTIREWEKKSKNQKNN